MRTRALQFIVLTAICARAAIGAESRKIIVWNDWGQLAIVNTERIWTRDVEERMGETAIRLKQFKSDKTKAVKWDAESEAQWTRLYVDGLRAALRLAIRDKLMIQQFNREKMTIDEDELAESIAAASRTNKNLILSDAVLNGIKDRKKRKAFRSHLEELKISEDDWLRSVYSQNVVIHIEEGNYRPLPIEFFFPGEKKSAEARALEVKKFTEAHAPEKTIPPVAPTVPAFTQPDPPRSAAPCPPCPCPPPPCPLSSRR